MLTDPVKQAGEAAHPLWSAHVCTMALIHAMPFPGLCDLQRSALGFP